MTGASPLADQGTCPLPPADLNKRKIPDVNFDISRTPLLRIHPTIHSPLHFNRPAVTGKVYRFDAPNDEYGTLYASADFDVCVTETLIRDQLHAWPFVIDEHQITGRSISTLRLAKGHTLHLVDLTAALFPIGGTTAITSVPAYDIPKLVGQGFLSAPRKV